MILLQQCIYRIVDVVIAAMTLRGFACMYGQPVSASEDAWGSVFECQAAIQVMKIDIQAWHSQSTWTVHMACLPSETRSSAAAGGIWRVRYLLQHELTVVPHCYRHVAINEHPHRSIIGHSFDSSVLALISEKCFMVSKMMDVFETFCWIG